MNLSAIPPFLDNLFIQLQSIGMDLNGKVIDHICYRTSSLENYQAAKEKASLLGELLIESEVNGRPIATYKLDRPIAYKDWVIPLIEVPAPKKGKLTPQGFEHIEVVITESFTSLIERYPHLSFNTKALTKEINPDIELELKGCAIKFHHQTLEEIIEFEKQNFPLK